MAPSRSMLALTAAATLALSAAASAAPAESSGPRQLLCGATLNGVGGDMGKVLEKRTGVVKGVSVAWGVPCVGARRSIEQRGGGALRALADGKRERLAPLPCPCRLSLAPDTSWQTWLWYPSQPGVTGEDSKGAGGGQFGPQQKGRGSKIAPDRNCSRSLLVVYSTPGSWALLLPCLPRPTHTPGRGLGRVHLHIP